MKTTNRKEWAGEANVERTKENVSPEKKNKDNLFTRKK
jgi:hypothetical protein